MTIVGVFLCVLPLKKKTLTCKKTCNNKRDIKFTILLHCAVRITSMTMENDECVTCRWLIPNFEF